MGIRATVMGLELYESGGEIASADGGVGGLEWPPGRVAGSSQTSGAGKMRFSWTGLILAPLLVPALFGLAVGGSVPSILFMTALASIVSYGTTLLLFLPSLFLLSRWQPMTGLKVSLLGLVLGMAMFVLLTLVEWKSSGPDSGPPTENVAVFFLRSMTDPVMAIVPLAGLVTASLYWWLGTWRSQRTSGGFVSPS
jgi:hypothetical protein